MADKSIRYVIRYSGHVQGVGFRMTSVTQAHGLNIHGFVRNEPDGSVLVDVEGTVADVKEFMRRVDSALSDRIDGTAVDERPTKGSVSGFSIQY